MTSFELHFSSNCDAFASQDRSACLSNADKATTKSAFKLSSKHSVNIPTRSTSYIGAFIKKSCTTHYFHFVTYVWIGWSVLFIRTNVVYTAVLLKEIVALHCSCKGLRMCGKSPWYGGMHANSSLSKLIGIIKSDGSYSALLNALNPSPLVHTWCDEDKPSSSSAQRPASPIRFQNRLYLPWPIQ